MSNQEVTFAPINLGGTKEIPPDAPEGAWLGAISVKKAATSKDNYPMLILDVKLVEAFTDGNESAVGSQVSDFLTFFPRNARGFRMSVEKLHEVCAALNIPVPDIQELNSWDDIAGFIDNVNGAQARVWTKHEPDKRERTRPGGNPQAMRTSVLWKAPAGLLSETAYRGEEPAAEGRRGKRNRS